MTNDAAKPSEVLKKAQKEFDEAVAKYRTAFQRVRPLAALDSLPTPPLVRAAYSDRMAWIMANMVLLAYINFEDNDLERERLDYALRSGAFNLIRTFDHKSTQAFLAKNDEFAVLSFRGTQQDKWEDIQTDIDVIREKTVDGKVHVGFKTAFDDVKDLVLEALRNNIGDKMPLYITGHSLGAALATVATKELEAEFADQLAACYTFGSPRVGDGQYEKSIKAPVYRIVNATDIVTLLPFFLGTFAHVGDARYLSRHQVNGVYVLYRGMPNFVRTLECIIETLVALVRLSNPLGPWINAHSMDIYVAKLAGIAAQRNAAISNVTQIKV
jgi:triacylglycerol lipase